MSVAIDSVQVTRTIRDALVSFGPTAIVCGLIRGLDVALALMEHDAGSSDIVHELKARADRLQRSDAYSQTCAFEMMIAVSVVCLANEERLALPTGTATPDAGL